MPSALDVHFNLFEQRALKELFPLLDQYNITAIPYRIFCRGLLADRYKNSKEFPQKSRANYSWRVKRYITSEYLSYLNNLKEFANKNNKSLISLILNWTLSFKTVSQVCIGTSSIKQLKEIIGNLNDISVEDNLLIGDINKLNLPKNIFDLPETFFEK